jgi:hypothetical protein
MPAYEATALPPFGTPALALPPIEVLWVIFLKRALGGLGAGAFTSFWPREGYLGVL